MAFHLVTLRLHDKVRVGVVVEVGVRVWLSDARRFIFRQPAAACPKWPGVAAFGGVKHNFVKI
jgi:hypothetical protein